MDAITLLKDDHKTVEQLFKRFEKAGDRAYAEKRKLVDRMIEELSTHAAIEEQVFYPVVRATVPKAEDMTLESLEEHHVVKWLLSELDGMDPHAERFDAKVTVLMESVRHHVEEEESDLFPKVRDALGRKDLQEVGEALAEAKDAAPSHPHPRSPDTPPGNLVVGAAAGVVDKVGDTVSGIAQGGVSVVQDLVARILDRGKPSSGPTGSTTTRKRAKAVREAGNVAAKGAERTARTARSGARSTSRAASRGASRTTGAAKQAARTTRRTATSSARRTASTAKGAASRTRKAATSR